MRFFVIKSRTIKIVLGVILAMVLLAINIDGQASAQVFFNKTSRKVPIYEVETSDKKVAISFDASWGADKTTAIMDVLNEYEVNATFFLVGMWVDKYPDLVKEIDGRGFEIGTHSNTHPDLTKLDSNSIKLELETSIKKIQDLTNKTPKLFRAPFGAYNNTLIEEAEKLNLTTIQWSVDSLDWKGIEAEELSKNILTKVKNGSIILCHNNSDHIVDALPTILKCLKEQGYTVTSVGNLIYQDNYTIDANGIQKSTNSSN